MIQVIELERTFMAELVQREQQLIKLVRAISGLAGGLLCGAFYHYGWEAVTVTAVVVFIAWYKIESWIQNS